MRSESSQDVAEIPNVLSAWLAPELPPADDGSDDGDLHGGYVPDGNTLDYERLAESMARRLDLLRRIGTDKRRQALALAVCSRDVSYWVNHFVWTFDPRERVTTLPFDLFPRQEEFLRWVGRREARQRDGVAEKCRDVGFTWLCAAYAVHGWLFRDGFSCGFGSRKLELVDKIGDPSSIFEKIRFILRNLPAWMLPAGFKWTEHDNFAKLINPENGSTVTGEGGDNIGRGARASVYFVDEYAFVEHADKVDAALSQTSRCKLFVSTPNGPGNSFARKRFSGKFAVFTFRWTDDPRKTEEWYRDQCEKYDAVTVAQEIDIDYTASIEGITIPAKWVRAAVDLELPGVVQPDGTVAPYVASGPVVAGLDVSEKGQAKTVLIGRQGPVVKMPVAWGGLETWESADKAAVEAEKIGAEIVNYDAVGVGTGIKGRWNQTADSLKFRARGISGGDTPSQTRWPNGRTSQEQFLNLRAEIWWLLRARFEKAYAYRVAGVAHPAEEMISIPNCEELIADLSMPLSQKTSAEKIKLESKEDMGKRGVKSPDFGDALAYSFAPVREWQVW